MLELRRERLTRYVTPLREGGSLPALAEAEDGFKYVVKFRGSGHGEKSVIAELIGGEVMRAAGMKVPELVFLDIDEDFGRTEGDEEIQDLLKASQGLNIGLHFLSGALTFDPLVNPVDEKTASRIVWLDAFLTNVDRTSKNTNMLIWNRELWLIDHGSTLYFHHGWSDPAKAALSPFPFIKDHVLLRKASMLEDAEKELKAILTPEKLKGIVALIPDDWLPADEREMTPDEIRNAYADFLISRIENSSIFTRHAIEAREKLQHS